MKRYFMEYESDRKICGSFTHIFGFASTIKTARQYINRCRKQEGEYNPRNFRIYDTQDDASDGEHVPCVYQEN